MSVAEIASHSEAVSGKERLDKVRETLQERWKLKKSAITATLLHDAAESGDMNKVRKLVESGECGVNCTDSIGWSPLHYACTVGNLDMVRMLISEFRADTTAQDVDGRTALMLAAVAGHDHIVHALLSEYQCPVDTKDKYGNVLLHFTCGEGRLCLIRTLKQKHNADFKVRNIYGAMPVHMAAINSKEQVTLALITEFGCDSNTKDNNGQSLLHYACKAGNISLVRTLIQEHKADITAKNENGNMPVHIAARYGREEVILALITEFGCDTNIADSDGWTLLHNACKEGNVYLVRTLIQEHKADITAKNENGNMPVHIAAKYDRGEVILALITEFGCDTNIANSNGWTLLHYACKAGNNVSLVRTLIEHKADTTAKNKRGDMPVHIAAYNGRGETIMALITEFGCDANIADSDGWTLLHYACKAGNVSLVRTLIEHKADITAKNKEGDMPVHIAAYNGRGETIMALITEFGCDANIEDSDGWTLLHYACKAGNVSLVQTLIEHKADITAKNKEGDMPVHIAVCNDIGEVILALITEFGCDTNIANSNGWTLLHYACKAGNVSLVRTLIKHKADITVKNNRGDMPVHIAADYDREEVILALITEFGCDTNIADSNGWTLLHYACKEGNVNLVRTLIEHKADITAKNNQSNMPVHIAVKYDREEVILALITEFGCDTNIAGSNGWTLLHYACKEGNVNLVRTLIEHKADITAKNNQSNMPVHIAVKYDREEVILALITEFGCDTNIADFKGWTLLHYACKAGNVSLVQTLIEHKADIL